MYKNIKQKTLKNQEEAESLLRAERERERGEEEEGVRKETLTVAAELAAAAAEVRSWFLCIVSLCFWSISF